MIALAIVVVMVGGWFLFELGFDFVVIRHVGRLRHEVEMRRILVSYWIKDRSQPFPPMFGESYKQYTDQMCDAGHKLWKQERCWEAPK